jgi:hypothetical protein
MKKTLLFSVFLISIILLVLTRISSQEQIKLKATAEESLETSFVADEKNLRRLNEVIKKRIAEHLKSFTVKYTVSFSDHSYYETEDFEIIFKEENSKARRIISIEMLASGPPFGLAFKEYLSPGKRLKEGQFREVYDTDPAKINVKLSPGLLSYSIRGANRDWVFITQSDISERFKNISQRKYGVQYIISGLCGLFGFLVILMPFAIRWRNRYDKKMLIENPTHTKTPLSSYIFSLRDPYLNQSLPAFLGFICIISCVLLGVIGYKFSNYLFPDTVFEIGDQIREFEGLKDLRKTLIWGIGVTVFLGFISGVAANIYSRRRQIHK